MRQKRNHDKEMRWKQHHVNQNEKQYIRKKPNRLRNVLKRKIAATDTNYMAPTILFQALVYGAPLTWFKPTEWMLKKVATLGDGYNSKGIAIPVNVDLNVEEHMIKPPLELVREAIINSSYRVIQDKCACRTH